MTPEKIAMLRAHALNMLVVRPNNLESRDKLELLDALAAAEAREARLREALTDIAVNGRGEEARRAQDALATGEQG
jgi:hypothetical protein